MRDAISRLDMREKSIPQRITVIFFFFFFKLSKKNIYLFFFFYGHGKFGVHGRFAIYWISRNNGPRCIGSPVYWLSSQLMTIMIITITDILTIIPNYDYHNIITITDILTIIPNYDYHNIITIKDILSWNYHYLGSNIMMCHNTISKSHSI